jgi:phosphohistidine swiveling domain-containing protein
VLVRPYAVPEDVPAIRVAAGLLTTTGGITSHAAVMARGLGKPAVVSCEGLEVAEAELRLNGRTLSPNELISVDGGTGRVYAGAAERVRLPGGHGVQRLLELLRARRQIRMWVLATEGLGEGEVARLGADGRLEGAPPSGGTVRICRGAPPEVDSLPDLDPDTELAVEATHFLAWAVALDARVAPVDPGPHG